MKNISSRIFLFGVDKMIRKINQYTIEFENVPAICGFGSVVGKKEAAGPLGEYFDRIHYDTHIGQDSWEKAESMLQKQAVSLALQSSGKNGDEIGYIFSGDLLNQCISSSYGLKDFNIPYLGQYGACSTMAQGLIMSAVMCESGACENSVCVTSSHFCSAERQYRYPLDYGGQRPPTAQWTVTGSGSCVISNNCDNPTAYIKKATVGRIIDLGVKDANNMGAAMAPAAFDTFYRYFQDTNTEPDDYEMIFTGDLGTVGSSILYKMLYEKGYDIQKQHRDCGMLIFDLSTQDVHAGGSGCGCAASVLCSYILKSFQKGELHNILFMATGALLSPTSTQQGESIPSVAHLVNITDKVTNN